MIPRRRMLFGADPIKAIINAFKTRVAGDGGTTEAESCLNQSVVSLKSIGLYDKASLILTPNAYKASKIYAAKPTDGSGDLTFSRASAAMRRNSAGLWESIASGVPRLHYPIGGGCPSWLIENQITNLIPNSNTFIGDTTKTTGITDSPISGVTSVRCTKASASIEYVVSSYSAIIANSTPYAPSLYFKYDGHNIDSSLEFNNGNDWGAVAWRANIEIRSTGITIVLQQNCTAILVAETNGWYRLEVSLTTGTVTNNSGLILIKASGANGASFLICTSNLTQSREARSPILTAGANVTRVADFGSKNFGTYTEGTIFYDDIPLSMENYGGPIMISAVSNSPASCIGLIDYVAGNTALYVSKAGVTTSGVIGTDVKNVRRKYCIVFSQTRIDVYRNGNPTPVLSITDATKIPSSISFYNLNYDVGGPLKMAYQVNQVLFSPILFTAAEAAAITAL